MFECAKSQYILYKGSNFLQDIQISVIEKRLKIKDFFEAFLARVRSKTHTFRFTQNNHISFYQSGTFCFAGLTLVGCGVYERLGGTS